MSEDDGVIGDQPLVDGMNVSVRIRRDFTIRDAGRLLDAARRAYIELHPDASPDHAATIVTCAADAVFTLLEREGLLGDDLDDRLSRREADGLEIGGQRAQVVNNVPDPLPARPDCLRNYDVFALPPGEV